MYYNLVGETVACKSNEWRPIPQLNSASDMQFEETEKRENGKKCVKRLPVFAHKGGRRLQYAWDGRHLQVLNDKYCSSSDSDRSRKVRLHGWLENCVDRMGESLKAIFVPEHVSSNYNEYLRWKCLHRIFSSALQVQCTQAMLRAVGVGAKRALPSAAAVNWVLKDGLGRLGRFLYTASLGRTFDSDLKRVRFSTSIIFSMSLGLELMTPKYPEKFLLLAAIANVAKSISLSAYLATSSTIHRSFALADNLADISAKGQAQTVVLDNLGLGLAVCMNHLCKHSKRVAKIMALTTFPIFATIDLFALYNGLQTVQFSTLNKVRLEIVIERWLRSGRVPSVKEVNKEEGVHVLPSWGRRLLPLRIGAPKVGNQNTFYVLDLNQGESLDQQKYMLLGESCCNWLGTQQNSLLLWPHTSAGTIEIVLGVLQACHLRGTLEDQLSSMGGNTFLSHCCKDLEIGTCSLNSLNLGFQYDEKSMQWHDALQRSQSFAQDNIQSLLAQMEGAGWQLKHVVLSSGESLCYSTS